MLVSIVPFKWVWFVRASILGYIVYQDVQLYSGPNKFTKYEVSSVEEKNSAVHIKLRVYCKANVVRIAVY